MNQGMPKTCNRVGNNLNLNKMKKHFLTFVVLATVAVGGAFAGNLHRSILAVPAGTLDASNPCPLEVDCTTTSGPICTNASNQALFTTDLETGNCEAPLFRIIQ